MNVITEKEFWKMVEAGEKPCAIANAFELLMTEDGYFVPVQLYIQLPEVRAKLKAVGVV